MNLGQAVKMAAKSISSNKGRSALTMLGIIIGLAAVIIGEVIFSKLFTNFGLKLLAVSIGAVIYYFVLQIVLDRKSACRERV